MEKNDVIVAAVIALLIGGLIGWFGRPVLMPTPVPQQSIANVNQAPAPVAPVVTIEGVPESEVELQLAMRKLWEDHVTWTRLYMISEAGSLKDKEVTAARLLK